MKKITLLSGLLLINFIAYSQTINDSILANERTIDRPISLHRGQLQVNPAYQISVFTKEFGSGGEKIDLTTNAKASVMHKYLFEVNYGILDFLQLSTAFNYAKKGERGEIEYIIPNLTEKIIINSLDEYKGFDDLYIGALFKIPFKTKKFEIAISSGIYIPWFSNEPKKPEHNINIDSSISTIIYHNNYKMAKGALGLKIGASTILRLNKSFSINAQFNYSGPVSESQSVRWMHQLNETTFEYQKNDYKYLISNSLEYKIDLHYQAIPWFNTSLSYIGLNNSEGWSEISGLRIGNLEKSLSLISIAYEIIVTGNLWFYQFVNIPLAGKNQSAPLSINTGISYNLFPFNKRSKTITIE